ncbi:MAG: hypothetical protein R3C11_01415 [Planctomycetaceae bacterium]
MGAELNQLRFQDQHIENLINCMNLHMEQTYCEAPLRHQSYELSRTTRDNSRIEERLFEKAIWSQWHYSVDEVALKPFLKNHCEYIQSYQVPLQKSRKDEKWGKIDLVGVTSYFTPSVIELKRKNSKETPLRMIIEGVAYALAIRKSWNHQDGSMYEQWKAIENLTEAQLEIPETLNTVPVIGIAPSEYWNRKFGQSDKVKSDRVPSETWPAFKGLCRKFAERGFPITLMQFESEETDDTGLPKITNLRKVTLPK